MTESIISNEKRCVVCGRRWPLHKHHIFFGYRRKRADEDGCWCYLCADHHNMSKDGVHFNRDLDVSLKRVCQIEWMKRYGDLDDFIHRYGRNYLE